MPPSARTPLSRDRILRAAIDLADRDGLEGCTMRRIAGELGVEAMSLYRHVKSKDDLLSGLVDLVFGEIELGEPGTRDWQAAMRDRARSQLTALRRHRWAIGLMEGRMRPGPESLRVHDTTLGILREAGFAFRAAVRANSVLDAYVYGFALQERDLPARADGATAEVMREQIRPVPRADAYPYLLEAMGEFAAAGYDYDAEFSAGLELILAGIARSRR
ncbi:MAG TPA: TetR/AcrR family transcriptional regulator [Solirubrobacteraceae bacterium]|jgi:AcrR family transcriptional regulator